jgi:hypothetical protein
LLQYIITDYIYYYYLLIYVILSLEKIRGRKMSNDIKQEILELKRNQELIITLLTPVFTISTVAKLAGRTPQAVRDWLTKNAEPDVGFFKKDGKIIVSEEVALQYINARR